LIAVPIRRDSEEFNENPDRIDHDPNNEPPKEYDDDKLRHCGTVTACVEVVDAEESPEEKAKNNVNATGFRSAHELGLLGLSRRRARLPQRCVQKLATVFALPCTTEDLLATEWATPGLWQG
jgi:hypothetical protein